MGTEDDLNPIKINFIANVLMTPYSNHCTRECILKYYIKLYQIKAIPNYFYLITFEIVLNSIQI